MRLILEGKKTATRRLKGRYRLGSIQAVQTRFFERARARIRILRKYRQALGAMREEDARKEGGYTLPEFRDVWREIHGCWDPTEIVWVYEFALVPGSLVKRPGRCVCCGSWRVWAHFGISEYAFSECEDCGAVYNGQGDLTHPLPKEARV